MGGDQHGPPRSNAMRQKPRCFIERPLHRFALAGCFAGGALAVLVGMADSDVTASEFLDFPKASGPIELGQVDWIRNYDEGVSAVEETGKPMLLLFQEVPG